jgi:mannitol/fructose-specific phosphotransferase system IIA component (Ntr-type)
MNLTDMLSLEQLLPKITAADRWAVIDALVDALVRIGKIRAEDRDAVRKAVRDREATKSTGIGYGVALPHASVPQVQDAVAVVARLQPPVDFQALDDQPVRLSAFARLLGDKERRAKLENAQTAEEMLAVFRS